MQRSWITSIAAGLMAPALFAAEVPTPVSPGGFAAAAPVASACPTFSWAVVDGAIGYEIAVYSVLDDGTLELALGKRFAGAAGSWTPAAGECPAPGSRSAWSVRALTDRDAGRWSEAMLFETAGVPSADEVRAALDVLQRYQRTNAVGQTGPETSLDTRATTTSAVAAEAERRDRVPMPGPLVTNTISATPPSPTITPPASFSLSLEDDLDLGGYVFRDGEPFIHVAYGNGSSGNTALGLRALESVTGGQNRNTAVGFEAMQYSSFGNSNTAAGYRALRNNIRHSNTAMGHRALETSSQGRYNTAVGALALLYNQDTYANTALGMRALQNNTTGEDNTATGFRALYDNETGYRNTATGYWAMESNTTGFLNTAVGVFALRGNTTGHRNTAVGYRALDNNTSSYNTAVGYRAMRNNTTGDNNVAIGNSAGSGWTTGYDNIAIGSGASGSPGETGTIRIGGSDNQTATYIEGISAYDASAGNHVCIVADRLGTCGLPNVAAHSSSAGELALLRQQIADLNRVVADLRRRLEASPER